MDNHANPSKALGDGGGASAADHSRFDASQYAFFGSDVAQDIELGGLDDEDDGVEVDADASSTIEYSPSMGDAEEVDAPSSVPSHAEEQMLRPSHAEEQMLRRLNIHHQEFEQEMHLQKQQQQQQQMHQMQQQQQQQQHWPPFHRQQLYSPRASHGVMQTYPPSPVLLPLHPQAMHPLPPSLPYAQHSVDVIETQYLSREQQNKNRNAGRVTASKYMTSDELRFIGRIQWAATHSNEPYVEDYYHLAVQAKQQSPHALRVFSPSRLRDLPSAARTDEPHAYLDVIDALGRIELPSIHRPRPHLQVDDKRVSQEGESNSKTPLEQEPLLVARIAVEDGCCLLLDVEDIDRMLIVSQPPDGGAHLRDTRERLLKRLATSLHILDMFNAAHAGRVSEEDDLFLLRVLSLPKGRKLMAKYLHLLSPTTELLRVVATCIFRNLRFLFEACQGEGTTLLASSVAAAASKMDLTCLSACIAAVPFGREPPPLRPIGSVSGDGATLVLKSILDSATMVLESRFVVFPPSHTDAWQASFNAFFSVLCKDCNGKYESIMLTSPTNAVAAALMEKEMPVELLKASIPHTNDQQRRSLLEFSQRAVATRPAPSVQQVPIA